MTFRFLVSILVGFPMMRRFHLNDYWSLKNVYLREKIPIRLLTFTQDRHPSVAVVTLSITVKHRATSEDLRADLLHPPPSQFIPGGAPLLRSSTDFCQCLPPTNDPFISRTRQSTRDRHLRKTPAVASKRRVTRERTNGLEPLVSSVKCVSTLPFLRTWLWPNQ